MRPLTIDFAKNRIVMTRAFARKASDPSTKEYRELKDTMETFPTFSVENHTIKKCASKESYKGLNYGFMIDYINTHVDETKREKAMADLEEQIFLTKCHTKRFPTVRKWFLETYPEINSNFGKVVAEFEERNAVELSFLTEEVAVAA